MKTTLPTELIYTHYADELPGVQSKAEGQRWLLENDPDSKALMFALSLLPGKPVGNYPTFLDKIDALKVNVPLSADDLFGRYSPYRFPPQGTRLPIVIAAVRGSLDWVHFLIERGADLHAIDPQTNTPADQVVFKALLRNIAKEKINVAKKSQLVKVGKLIEKLIQRENVQINTLISVKRTRHRREHISPLRIALEIANKTAAQILAATLAERGALLDTDEITLLNNAAQTIFDSLVVTIQKDRQASIATLIGHDPATIVTALLGH